MASDAVHTLTSELQEVMVGLIAPACVLMVPDIDVALQIPMVRTAIPHSGQLNITNSTLFTPDLPVKSEAISIPNGLCICNVSSGLAHMSPSSPVSVGILSSNRTLLSGASHIE